MKCVVVETCGLREKSCRLCDNHCKRGVEGVGCPLALENETADSHVFYQRAYYIKPVNLPDLSAN